MSNPEETCYRCGIDIDEGLELCIDCEIWLREEMERLDNEKRL
jgi:hypothetical protein